MKRAALRFSGVAVMAVMVFLALTGLALAKSLYVIADMNTYYPNAPVQAYNVNPDGTLEYQAEYLITNVGSAVGLAVDTATDTLFITSEGSNIINLVDAKTMTGIGTATAPGAYDLAGIVVDDAKKLIYAVDRYSSNLYVYKWNAVAKTLTLEQQVTLPDVGGQGAFGIALDRSRGLLYVANYNDYYYYSTVTPGALYEISYYHTSDWSQAGILTLAGPAIGIAVDAAREFLYTGAGWGSYYRLDYYNLHTGATGGTDVDPGTYSGAMGIAVDEDTGLIYITTGYGDDYLQVGDELRVYQYNPETANLELLQNLGRIGSAPTGVAIGAGYNPLNLEKNAAARVSPGQNLIYTLSFDNLNNPEPIHTVVLTDNLPPETTFVSASDGGIYDLAHHAVTWNIGDVAAGAPSRSVRVTVQVNAETPPNTRIRNTATIDSDDTPPTTKSVETLVVVTPVFSLTFPIYGYTPYNAPVIAVLDHSAFETKPVKFYVKNDKVEAFNGEVGERVYGANLLLGYWDGYMNSDGANFLAGVLNYVEGAYLYYDGHPGYDYQVPKGTPIRATANGRLYIADKDPVNGGGWVGYRTFYIQHRVVKGSSVEDYYTWYLYVNLRKILRNQIAEKGFARVRKGQVIGRTYNDWMHVDFRRRGIAPGRIFDPYKEGMWEQAE